METTGALAILTWDTGDPVAMASGRHDILKENLEPLIPGDFLSRDEFLRRWEATPGVKRAELIRGVVYMPSPLSRPHAVMESNVSGWLAVYRAATPGCESGNNATWLMGDDAPQPDLCLYVLPEFGGRVGMRGDLLEGAPEFLAEICLTSTSYDLHQKLELYQEAGVQEYLAVLVRRREVRWHRLIKGSFEREPVPADGVHRSRLFPGLWLDTTALLAGDLATVLSTLDSGTRSSEHGTFLQKLERWRTSR